MNPYEEIVRQMVRHENDVMNHRIMWLLTLQGLLFAALGFSWDKQDARYLVYVFCATGAVVALSSLPVLDAADRALRRLRQWWIDNRPDSYNGPDVVGFWREARWNSILLPSRILPVLFILSWCAVAVINGAR